MDETPVSLSRLPAQSEFAVCAGDTWCEMSAELHYARNSGLRISRRVWIPTLIIGLIIGIALTRSKWSHLYSQAREAYLEQRCLRHTLPAGLVVYTSDPVFVASSTIGLPARALSRNIRAC